MDLPTHLFCHAHLCPQLSGNSDQWPDSNKSEEYLLDGLGQIMIALPTEPDCWMSVPFHLNLYLNQQSRQASANGEGSNSSTGL